VQDCLGNYPKQIVYIQKLLKAYFPVSKLLGCAPVGCRSAIFHR
jgi:hypothetical protein